MSFSRIQQGKHSSSVPRRYWSAFSLLMVSGLVAFGAAAVQDETPQPLTLPRLEPGPGAERAAADGEVRTDIEAEAHLDVAGMIRLGDRVLLQQALNDPVWQLDPQPGRRLVQIPITFVPGEESIEVSRSTISLRGGRFVCWRIEADDPREQRQHGFGQAPQRSAAQPVGQRPAGDGWGDMDMAPPPPPLMIEPEGIPDNAPMLTRRFVIHPTGMISWQLERAIPGAAVRETDGDYILKLRPDRLRAKEPTRERIVRQPNEDGRAFADRRRIADERYREQMLDYRELREQIMGLPDTFEMPLPQHVWAVFEIQDRTRELAFTGEPPLPWSLSLDDFEVLRQAASGHGVGQLDQRATQLARLLQDRHTLTYQALAMTLIRSRAATQSQVDDPVYRLTRTILEGPDDPARQMLVEELAATNPQTPATSRLLRSATPHLPARLQIISLRGLMQADANQQAQLASMVAAAMEFLYNEEGPSAGLVLRELDMRLRDVPDAFAATTMNLHFERLSPPRRDDAIAYVVSAAGESELAASWLNVKLLGSNSPELMQRTLEIIKVADASPSGFSRVTQGLMRAVFGVPAQQADAVADDALDVQLSGLIPITSAHHSLFRSINSGDDELRRLAWSAMPAFAIASHPIPFETSTDHQRHHRHVQPEDDPAMRMDLVVQAGLGRTPTPPELIRFLMRQPERDLAGKGLMDVVINGDANAAAQAARILMGSDYDLEKMFMSQSPGQRHAFAAGVYEVHQGEAPLIVGLLRDPNDRSPVIRWFADQLQTGKLPADAQWAEQFTRQEDLAPLAAAEDEVLAQGAMAAIMQLIGGDDDNARTLWSRVKAENAQGDVAEVMALLGTMQEEIYTQRLREAAGRYRLLMAVRQAAADTPGQGHVDADGVGPMHPGLPLPGQPPQPTGEARPAAQPAADDAEKPAQVLGIVDLEVTANTIRFANQAISLSVAPLRLAIRIDTPSELKNFASDAWADIPLEQMHEPIDLLPQEDGSWVGKSAMPDGRLLVLTLKPLE